MDVGDATLFGQHALAYAVLAYAAEYFRRRVLRFPLWQQAAQVAVLLVLCAALVLLVRVVGGAPLPRWTYVVPPLVGRAAVAGALGRAAVAAAAGALAVGAVTRRRTARRRDDAPLPLHRAARRAATPAAAAPSCATRSASSSCSAAALVVAGALVVLALRRRCSARFVYLQVLQHEHYQTLAETNRIAIVPIVPNRGVITDRNGVVLAQSYSAYTLEIQPSRVRNLDETIDALADDRRHPAARPQALPQAARGVEELREPAAAHAAHRRGGRALRRQPLPLPGRRDQGAAVPPVPVRRSRLARRRLHRPHQRPRRRAHRGVGRDRQLQGLRLHRQGRRRAVLRARAARHDRRRGGRGRRRRPRGAHAVAHAADRRQRPAAVARHQAAGGRRGGVRRPPRRAGGDRSRDRRRARVRLQARASTRTSSSTASTPANWELLNESPDKPLLNRPLRGAYPPGSTIKPFLALGALTSGKRTPTQTIFDPGFFQLPGAAHRFRDDKPGGHGTVDMYKSIVVSCDTYYYMLASETDIDDTHALHVAARLRPQDRHRHRGRAARRAAVARVEAAALRRQELPRGAPQVVPRRQHLGRASARATTRSRRCSSRTRSRRSPTTASPSARTSSSTIREPAHRRGPRSSRASRRTRSPLKPEHLAVIKNALVGVAQGRHQRARRSAGAPLRRRRQDRHRAGVLAQGREVRGAQGRRAAARPRAGSSPTRRPTSRGSRSRCWSRTAASARRPRRRSRARCFDYFLLGEPRPSPAPALPAVPPDAEDESD